MISEELHIADLIKKELCGEITPGEFHELRQWLGQDPRNRELYEEITEQLDFGKSLKKYETFAGLPDFGTFCRTHGIDRAFRLRRIRKKLLLCAAVLLPLAVIFSVTFSLSERVDPSTDIGHEPGKAILVLSGGQSLSLSDSKSVLPSGAVVKNGEGQSMLSYRDVPQDAGRLPSVNRLIVPRGSDFCLELSDGTTVILDADSEIEYPEHFTDSTREVKLRGMAYFKVAHDPEHPFIVHTSRADVRVLGTEFCVQDQAQSSSQVTLVNGRVRVQDMYGETFSLKPGQQADITSEGTVVSNVETYYYTAWKDGYFLFRDTSLHAIMEKLAAWYDIDYLFRSQELMGIKISARIKKYDNVDSILELLSGIGSFGFERDANIVTVVTK